MFQRTAEGRRAEGAVDDQRKPMSVGYISNGLDINHVKQGVADGFGVERLGLVGNGRFIVVRVGRIDKVDLDAHRRKNVVELGIGAAIQVVGRYDFIA